MAGSAVAVTTTGFFELVFLLSRSAMQRATSASVITPVASLTGFEPVSPP